MPAYRVLFLSSAEISTPLLRALNSDERFEVIGLICQPDKLAGRGQNLMPPAAKVAAEAMGLTVFQPEKLSDADVLLAELSKNPPDFLLTFAYGQLLSEAWLALPKLEALNVHTSLLPSYRGASPIQAALLNGDKETGITLMRMVKKMDAGPYCDQFRVSIGPGITAGELHDALAELAAVSIPDALANLKAFVEQDESEATYCGKIDKANAYIDFTEPADLIFKKWQAYTPWPALWTLYGGKRLKLIGLSLPNDSGEAFKTLKTGELFWENEKLYVGTSEGVLCIDRLQLEGKSVMRPKSFILGQPDFLSSVLPS